MSDDQGTVGVGHVLTSPPEEFRTNDESTVGFPARTAPLGPDHLICPCCHHSVPTVDEQGSGIHCEKCGNSFRLARIRQGSAIDEIRVIGRFQLLDRVGHGSYGTVWRARDTQLDRVVALKVPHEHALECGLDTVRVEREARVAAQLRHAGIVRLYEILTLDNVPILVSDFIEGTSLRKALEERRLTFWESALLVAQVAEALDHAHDHGLVHRDIKPANIMMERPHRGDDRGEAPAEEQGSNRLGRPILVDFGLAVRPEADTIMTMDGEIVGTPAYMSPEQAAGKAHHVDRRSDIYSLGVVLYQLLCGELPFRGSRMMIVHQLLHEDPRPPRRVNDRIPRDLETICLKALAKQPSRRYATAAELAADLRRFLRGEPCRARPVGRLERGWLWALRNKALAAAFAMAAVLMTATVAGSVLYAVWEQKHADQLRNALRETNERLAENYLDRGLALCERGEVAHGLLLLARGQSAAPGEAVDLGRVLRMNLAAWQANLDPLAAERRHGELISTVAFSPDGRRAATGGWEGRTIRLWEGPGAEPLGGTIECPDLFQAMAFSPDGLSLAIACRDGTARFWDIRQGRFRPAALAHGQRVYAVAYSHDGKVLATGGLDGQVKLWNPDDGRPLSFALRHEAPIRMVAFAPDDRTIVTVAHSGAIRPWDARTGAPRQPPATHPKQEVLAAALSPDGRWLATGCQDGWARVWDAASLKLVHELPHPALVRAVGFSPDGRTLLTGGSDKVARLWDVRSGESLGPAAYHQQAVGAVAFSPDGSRIVTGSDDGVCQFRRRRTDHPRCLELAHRAGVGVVGISPDGRIALTGTRPRDVKAEGEGEVRLWDLPTGKPLARLTHAGIVTAAIFSADGRTLATAGADGTARLVDVASGKVLCPPLCHEGWVQAIAFDPGGAHLLTGCEDTIARLWDVRSGRFLDRSIQHEQPVVAVAFSPDGTLALTGSSDGCVKLWDVATGRERHVFRHRDFVETVAFSPDGKIVLTASLDHTARLWRVDSGQPIGKPLFHQDEVLCAAFSPDGAMVLTGSKDNTAQLWRVATTEPLGPPLTHQGPVDAVAYSPDRATVATASRDETVRFWDIATGRPLGPALRHGGPVAALAFSPDGRRLITGSWDGKGRIWETLRTFDASPDRSATWIQTLCGMELTANEALGLLTPERWQQRCQELREMGGPPVVER